MEISDSSYPVWVEEAFRAARKAGAGEDVARDCADEAIARLLRADDPPPNPVAWLRRTAKNLAIDRHRAGGRLVSWPRSTLSSLTRRRGRIPILRSLGGPALARMDWDRVRSRLPELLTRTELSLLMDSVQGCSIEELAARHGLTRGSVRTILSRARKKIRVAFPDLELEYRQPRRRKLTSRGFSR